MSSKPDTSIMEPDKNNLDEEWVKQPKLFTDWAIEAAAARLDYDEAKADVDVVRADISLDVRTNPEKYDIEKITEKAIDAAIVLDAAYVKAMHKLRKAKHRFEVASALVSGLEQRKSSLENLVKLRLANYFAEPQAPKECREEMEEMKKDRAFHPRRRKEQR